MAKLVKELDPDKTHICWDKIALPGLSGEQLEFFDALWQMAKDHLPRRDKDTFLSHLMMLSKLFGWVNLTAQHKETISQAGIGDIT